MGGSPVKLQCAENLEFDPISNNCIPKTDSTCFINRCPAEHDLLVFLPGKYCPEYYVCVKGQPILQKCAAGMHWSAKNTRCEPISTANCVE